MKSINFFIKIFTTSLFLFLGLFFSIAYASGTIDSSNYSAQICENAGCTVTSTSPVNFGYFTTSSSSNIVVSDTSLSGYMWGSSLGWVVLNCSLTASGCSATNGNFKVSNTNGILSGYGWGETAGWVNFGPFAGSTTSPININLITGEFNGYAWSQNFGWIKFDCSNSNYCTKTTWRPQVQSGSSGNYPQIQPQLLVTPVRTIPDLIPNTLITKREPKAPPRTPDPSYIEDIPIFEVPFVPPVNQYITTKTPVSYDQNQTEKIESFIHPNFLKGIFSNLTKNTQDFISYVKELSVASLFFKLLNNIFDWFEYLVTILALFLLIWLLLFIRPFAYVVSKETMEPFNSGIVTFSKINTGEIVKTVELSSKGSYRAFLRSGVYIARVEEKQQDGTTTIVHTSEPMHLSTGFVKNTLFV